MEKQSQTNLLRTMKSRMGRSLRRSYEHNPMHQIILAKAFDFDVSDIDSNRYVKMMFALVKLTISIIILYNFYVIVGSFFTILFTGCILLLMRLCRKINR